MSNGPIQRERDAWKPAADKGRVCFAAKGRGYCGRMSAKARVADWREVTCADCKAAAIADGMEVA